MLRKKIRFASVLILVLSLVRCGNKDVPEWFTQPPNVRYVAATATAEESQTAIDAATRQATVEATRQIEARIEGRLGQFSNAENRDLSIPIEPARGEIARAVATEVVVASGIKQKKVIEEKAHHRAYVLVEVPLDAEDTILVQQVSQREAVYQHLRLSESYREVEQVELLKLVDWAVEETFVNAAGFGVGRVYPGHSLADSFNAELRKSISSRWSQIPEFNYTFHLATHRGRLGKNVPHKYTPIWKAGKYEGYERQPLTEVETELFNRVKAGESVVYSKRDDGLVGMGALRAREKCLRCHKGGEGKFLGAFAYTVSTE